MSNLLYLLAAIGLSAIGSAILYFRHRRPTSVESGMKEFNRGLAALDPTRGRPQSRQSRPAETHQGHNPPNQPRG